MPFQQTVSGLQIQPLSEIVSDLETDFREPTTGFGAGAQVAPNTPFGQLIGIWSEREALTQQLAQKTQSQFDPEEAEGIELDVISGYTKTIRRGEDQSTSDNGQVTGTVSTVVPTGARVQDSVTGEIWELTDGPYVIPAGGFIAASMIAQNPGPLEFLATTVWIIVDPVAGWDSFETTADIDPEDIGQLDETDESLRFRRKTELFAGGNDLAGIKAVVSAVVDEVAVYENRDACNTSPDGIPGGAFEVVTEGGDQDEISAAIFSRKPPGAQSFGTIIINQTDTEGNQVPIGHTPVTDVDIFVTVNVIKGDAEVAFPDNTTQVITDALLDFLNSSTAIGQDVLPETFAGPVFESIKDPESGRYPAQTLDIKAGITDFASVVSTPTPIDLRSRADYDTLRVQVVVVF